MLWSNMHFLLLILMSIQRGDAASKWTYYGDKGPSNWKKSYPACNGKSQSPIDIQTIYARKDTSLNINLNGADTVPHTAVYTLLNNGHTAQVNFENTSYILRGNMLAYDYKLAQFHLHWGKTSNTGSEHHVNGQSHPAEMHLVFYNSKHKDLSKAADKVKGLAVLGFFVEEETHNPNLEGFFNSLDKIINAGTRVQIAPFAIRPFLPKDLRKFYRYDGSLTTPGCYESVIWTVFHETIKVSSSQMSKLRAIERKPGEKIVNNYRPPQPINSRPVFVSFSDTVSKWSYTGEKGPKNWKSSYPGCGGKSQSPIDITTTATVQDTSLYITLTGMDAAPSDAVYTLFNNGHTAQVNFENTNYRLSGKTLTNDFKLAQFHLHWGETSATGSEHQVNGRPRAAELHLVFYNSQYKELSTAADKIKGLAVLGFFLEVGAHNSHLDGFFSNLDKVKHAETKAQITPFAIRPFLPKDLGKFYRYDGSLTTPGCHESVIWTVFHETIKVSPSQLFKLRLIEGHRVGDKIVNNYRPPQPVNSRTVFRSFSGIAARKHCNLFLLVLPTLFAMMGT